MWTKQHPSPPWPPQIANHESHARVPSTTGPIPGGLDRSTIGLRIADRRPLQSQKLSNPLRLRGFSSVWRKDRFLSLSLRRTTPRHCNRSSLSSSGFHDIIFARSSNSLSLSLSILVLCSACTSVKLGEGRGGKREEERKRAKARDGGGWLDEQGGGEGRGEWLSTRSRDYSYTHARR